MAPPANVEFPTKEELDDLTKNCTDAFNAMSDQFIKFSMAYVKLTDRLANADHPTLFPEKESKT
jgi:hypothetical protein